VTDFDGTLTRHDFFDLVLRRLVPPGTPDYWGEYLQGGRKHFETLRSQRFAPGTAACRKLRGQPPVG
jgi:hypothetical protein